MNMGYPFWQGDAVLIGVFCTLLAMSVASWYFIVTRGYRMWRYRRESRRFVQKFWDSANWQTAQALARTTDVPLAGIATAGIDALGQYRSQTLYKLGAACGMDEFLLRAIRNGLSQESAKLEGGLTVLASVGSTSPFVGLFGTVWGIYHALISIATQGNATLDAVAGPMGEALIATAGGLAAAIPAVLAYNALVRGNRVLLAEMDGFAHDLHAQLLMSPEAGQPAADEPAKTTDQAARRRPQLAGV